jgi:hypothetical protein
MNFSMAVPVENKPVMSSKSMKVILDRFMTDFEAVC